MFGELPTGRTRVPVVKVPGGSHVLIRVRCSAVLGLHVHWLGRRSYVCPGDDCAAHEQDVGSRWSGLIAVDVWQGGHTSSRFGLLELTEGAFTRLQFLRECEGQDSILGMVVEAFRSRKRSPLRFEMSAGETSFGEARKEWPRERIADAASTLYGLPPLRPGQNFAEWERAAIVAARRLVARAMTSLEQPSRQV